MASQGSLGPFLATCLQAPSTAPGALQLLRHLGRVGALRVRLSEAVMPRLLEMLEEDAWMVGWGGWLHDG